jgi:hypothetical protein
LPFCFQFIIYKDIKEKHGDRLWIDVVSKCDLLDQPSASACALDDLNRYKALGPEGAIPVSITSGVGVEEVICFKSYLICWLTILRKLGLFDIYPLFVS